VAQQWVLGVRKYHFSTENDIFSPLKTPLRGGAAAEQYQINFLVGLSI